MKLVDTGNHFAAWGARLARVEVVSAYPITPQTQVIEEISRFIDEGEMDCEYIPVESEHSAMAAMIGSAAMGVRSFSATSSHGLAYMHELLHWAAGIRLPMVMVNVNRAMGPGWNIWCDHQDALAARDTGWIQLYCASHQEVLDTVIQAYRISEDFKVILPVMVCYDAIFISHSYMQVEVPDQENVDRFLPPFRSLWKLDLDYPLTHGSVIYPDDYEEVRFSMFQGLDNARGAIRRAAEEYRDIIGNYHGDMVETYRIDDADCALVAMGSMASECKMAVDMLRDKGYRCGLVRVRSYRPFPIAELRELLSPMRAVMVLDRGVSFGLEGALFSEVKAAIYGHGDAIVYNLITGLGGRDVRYDLVAERTEAALEGKMAPESNWPSLRLTEHHRVSKRGLEEYWKREGVL
ncbi:MAG: transketolase C-terminal domain-containing protein [Actinomycetota bacterium]|nr:transketolase C-terminal domain-containing protein [Actinomycetota bacterium]MDD5666775.1 transketolase C-terminal domain-containing protein [Actinomycetota bacterium]